ncbi:protein PLANT CADMIUM RESISTANCE 2-like [Euphorbia lathyris]|uniref:protein PLANT CADMIUM RESISTANCE 2-like n=1 Tax=Euphorbia lathyris TaxID=212925 RepID=UPI0033132D78
MSDEWSSGLCSCCSDCNSCCLALWCPCISVGRIAEIADQGKTSCAFAGTIYLLLAMLVPGGVASLYSCMFRSKLRKEYKLKGNSCSDCAAHYFCGLCALSQDYRELQFRGFDLSAGWEGNMAKGNRGTSKAPLPESMTR